MDSQKHFRVPIQSNSDINFYLSIYKDRLETNVPLQMTFVRPFLAIFRHMYVKLSQN